MVSECELPPAQLLTEKPDKALARPGVYAILCDVSGRYYVGSSKDMRLRFMQHASGLRSGLHANQKMRYSYNKHGANRHLFKAIDFCSVDNLGDSERHWMSELDAVKNGMNIAHDPLPRRDWRPTDEQRKQMSIAMRRANLTNSRGAPFSLISPEGEVFCGKNISAFCASMGMDKTDSDGLSSVMNGLAISHKGWRAVGGRGRNPREDRPCCLMPPGSKVAIWISGLKNFCRINSLCYSSFGKLTRGETDSVGGWTCPNIKQPKPRKPMMAAIKKIISPSGEVIEFTGMRVFCEKNGLSSSAVYHVINGHRPHHKGWRKAP